MRKKLLLGFSVASGVLGAYGPTLFTGSLQHSTGMDLLGIKSLMVAILFGVWVLNVRE